MYKAFFGLRENPFNVNPDPRYLFRTREVDEALACLAYGIQKRRGFVLVTGEVGTGKTILLNKLLNWLRRGGISTAFIFNPRLNADQFLDFMLTDFGIQCGSCSKSQVLVHLNHWLLERYKKGKNTVMIVDEAQNLAVEVLEEIRLLTNLETSTEKLLQIVLSGQPELEETLRRPQLRQLLQRITLRCRMLPLTREETRGYILERLRIAGAPTEPIFAPEAMEAVHQFSDGIPRVINLLCEHALIGAFVEGQRPVLATTVEQVAREYDLLPNQPGPTDARGLGKDGSHLRESVHSLGVMTDRLRRAQ